MPPSEIDDIFSKKKFKAVPLASTSSAPQKNIKKKRDLASDATKKRPAPVTVMDPSIASPQPKRAKLDKSTILKQKTPRKKETDIKDEDRFKDSRGSGPRRKTEEGFSIYKEDELGIGDQGGDTPLCPFDCECCF